MGTVGPLGRRIGAVLELVRFEHTLFALPFAIMALFMASGGWPRLSTTWWILLCMVSARSSSMAFNRIADYRFDLENPRTRQRPLQTGRVTMKGAWAFTVVTAAIFAGSSAMLNRLAFISSFGVLAILFGYSFTKRLTWLSHILLGLCLGLAPVAVSIAVNGVISGASVLLCGAVTFWVAGFDVLYALQDMDFDEREGLKSIPARFGFQGAVLAARVFHGIAFLLFVATGLAARLGVLYGAGLMLIGMTLFWEHLLVARHGLARIDTAFFTMNGIVSIVFFAFSVADILIGRT